MRLQEQIRKVLREELLNETKFFLRRINDLDEIKNLLSINADQTYNETKSYDQFKYELTLRVVESIIWNRYGIGWEDLPEQEEIDYVTQVSNTFDKRIKQLYKEVQTYYNKRRKVLREELNNETFNPHNEMYLDAWLNVGDEDMESYEDYGIDSIGRIIDEVKELKFPLRIYRGINTLDKQGKHNLVDDLKYDNVSWSTSRYVSEEFGNVIYTGIVDSADDINLDYTIYRRILHKPLDENEIVMKDNRLIKNLKRFK